MLGVQLIKALGVRSVQLLCTDHPQRRATLLAIIAIERLFAPVAAARRLGRPLGGGGGGEWGGGGGKSGGAMALLRRRQLEAKQCRVVRLRAHGEALKRLSFEGLIMESSAFVVVSYASASGPFLELCRSAVVTREPNPRWPPLEAVLPSAAPRRIYLRLQVFAWRSSGRHKLIGMCGGLLEDLAPVRGRALPLQLLTPERRTGRGILWLDECKLAVLPVAVALVGDQAADQAGGAAMALRDRRQQERSQRRPGGASGGEGESGTEESGDGSGDESDGSELDGDNGAAGTERRGRYPLNDARG